MNKLDELVLELCPDGVEFKPVEAVAELKRGTSITKKHVQDGDIPVIAGGQKPAYYHNQSNRSGETIVIAGSGAYAGFVTFWNIPIFVSDAFTVIAFEDLALPKYVYYFLKSKQSLLHDMQRGGGVPHVYAKDVAPVKMPVPPLEVQKEIVSILDKFTQLEAELSAELSARRKQYEYYRYQLAGEHVFSSTKWVPLESVMTIKTGTKPSVIEKTPDGVPYINAGNEPSGYTNDKNTNGGVITIPSRGQGSAGHIGYQSQDFWCGPLCYRVDSNTDRLLNKFVYYYLKNIQSKVVELRKIGSIPAVNKSDLGKVMIPVPTMLEQEKTVKILDSFDKLANDINEGIPAEINVRRQQYEYYRTKLLTFQELSV